MTHPTSKAKTFKEWNDEGYQIKRGERAVGRNVVGEAVFSDAQVQPRRKYIRNKNYYTKSYDYNRDGWDYEGSWEEMIPEEYMGGPFDG